MMIIQQKKQRKNMSLYNLALHCIASKQGEEINFTLKQLPKVVHIDINRVAYRCNFPYYFALIHSDFDMFADLLISNQLNDFFLFFYLRKNKHDSSKYIVSRYLEQPSHVILGLALGKLLKKVYFLNESETILKAALSKCTLSIVSMHILKERIHLYCLKERFVKAERIFDWLKKNVLELENVEVIKELASVYNGLAAFLLEERWNIDESKYWNDKALRACDESITKRENIEILLMAVKITRMGFPDRMPKAVQKMRRENLDSMPKPRHHLYDAVNTFKCLCDSKDSLCRLYAAKIVKEVVKNYFCFFEHRYRWHYYIDYILLFSSDLKRLLRPFDTPFCSCLYSYYSSNKFIIDVYKDALGEQHAKKVEEKLKLFIFL